MSESNKSYEQIKVGVCSQLIMAGAILDEAAERPLGKVTLKEIDEQEAKRPGEGAAGTKALCRAGEQPAGQRWGAEEARETSVREEANRTETFSCGQ